MRLAAASTTYQCTDSLIGRIVSATLVRPAVAHVILRAASTAWHAGQSRQVPGSTQQPDPGEQQLLREHCSVAVTTPGRHQHSCHFEVGVSMQQARPVF